MKYSAAALFAVFCLTGMPCLAAENHVLDRTESVHATVERTLAEEKQTPMPKKTAGKKPKKEEMVQKGDLSLHVTEAPAAEVIRSLAELTGKNVVFSGEIRESVTASLENVTADEALYSVLAACGLVERMEGSTMVIFSHNAEKNAAAEVKSYRLSYGNAKEVSEGLKNILSSGKVTYSASSNTVLLSGSPMELMQADRLIRLLDVPEKQVRWKQKSLQSINPMQRIWALIGISKVSPAVPTTAGTVGVSRGMSRMIREISSMMKTEIRESGRLSITAGM